MNKPIEIRVGGSGPYDPAAGDTDCVIPTIKGSVTWIEKTGYGPYSYSLYSVLSQGGFRLTGGATFEDGETWYVHASVFLLASGDAPYTNGFDYSQCISALFGRLGWRASTLSDQPVLSSNNTTSRSGRYFNDMHALVTIPNIKSVLDNPNMTDDEFNAELESIQKSVIMRCLNGVFSEKEYLEQVLLFNRLGMNDQAVTNSGLFVGYEINVAKDFDKAVQVDSATLLFDSNKTFTVYCFKDGKKTPVWSQEVTVVANESTVVDLNDLILNYINPSTKGSRFFLGYFQDDLGSAKAIREQVECWNNTHVFKAEAFYSVKTSGQTDFDRDQRSYTYEPMGMNLQISSFSDWTGMIVKKSNLFDELQGLSMAYVVIERIVYSTASNGTERLLKDGIMQASAIQDLTGSAPVSDGPAPITGLNKRMEREILRVKKSLFPIVKAQTVSLC